MKLFLENTVEQLQSKYGDQLSELCIVVPNRRAGLFFKQHLAKKINHGIWSPEIFSSEDFIEHLAQIEILDPATLLFELYEAYLETFKKEADSFAEFSKWGNILIQDFNEIDRYLIDAEKLYANLRELKEIENWSFNAEQLSPLQTQYLSFWNKLGSLYTNFSKKLLNKNQAYQGLAYKIVAEQKSDIPWHKVIFVGFNALNIAEEKIIHHLVLQGKADIIWDSDPYYTDNPLQEAGQFIRKYKKIFETKQGEKFLFEENLLSETAKNIQIIGAPKLHIQAKTAGDIVDKLKIAPGDLQKTAIVLADETLLFPALHALPENIKEINVTMGYPLKSSPLATLCEVIFDLHENAERMTKDDERFYHKDIIKFFEHPYIKQILPKKEYSNAIIEYIRFHNLVFTDIKTLKKGVKEISFEAFSFLFDKWKNTEEVIACFYQLIDLLKSNIKISEEVALNNKEKIELEFVFMLNNIIRRIKVLNEESNT